VYAQFRDAVAESRKLPLDEVIKYADGRVMTGATAVKLKFADSTGTFQDAVKLAADQAKLGDDYHLFRPRRERPSFFQLLMDEEDEDDLNSSEGLFNVKAALKGQLSGQTVEAALKTVFKLKYMNQPMMIMPGYWE
jgi:protease IV